MLQVISESDKTVVLKSERSESAVNMVQSKFRSFRCYRCNQEGHIGANCMKSKNHTCAKCNRKGHFEVCCRTKQAEDSNSAAHNHDSQTRGRGYQSSRGSQPRRHLSRGRGRSRGKGNQNVRCVDFHEDDAEQAKGESSNIYCFSINSKCKSDVELVINDVVSQGIIDSGSDCSLMSVKTFQKVNEIRNVDVEKCHKNVYVYGSNVPLETVGHCYMNCKVKQTGYEKTVRFIIVPKDVPTLISRNDSIELGILQLGKGLVCSVKSDNCGIMPDIKAKYPSVFSGLGKLRNYQLRLHIDESVPPFAQPVRRITFSRREKVLEKLRMLESMDVIEKVQTPTSWVNSSSIS